MIKRCFRAFLEENTVMHKKASFGINAIIKIILLISIAMFSTGCIDMLSHTTLDKDGNLKSAIKFTIVKTDDDDEFDPEEFGMDDVIGVNYISSYEFINTEFEYGVYAEIFVPKNELYSLDVDDTISSYIPVKFGNSYYMSFISDEMLGDEASSMLAAFKYQIFISKSYINNIHSAVIKNIYDDEYRIEFYDLHDTYLIEIPMMFFGSSYLVIN